MNRPNLEKIQQLLNGTTTGKWGITGYAGGFNFNGEPKLYCGTDANYGEPLLIPACNADREFIAIVHNTMQDMLDYIKFLEAKEES